MNSYITPEQAAAMAAIEDPKDRMNTFAGMQGFANQLPAMNRIKERDNGRVVGRTSMMEGLGQMGSQLAGAAMQKNMMDKYGAIMDKNNASRSTTAERIVRALRGEKDPIPANPNLPTGLTPYEVDYYGE
jgi:hypothetical protein